MLPDNHRVTGLCSDDMRRLLEEVRANHAKLESCAYHEFDRIGGGGPRPLRDRYRCLNCGGEIDAIAYSWHEKGRRPCPSS